MTVCDYRSVDKDGRIICQKITEGDREVSPNLCRDCPAKQVSCDHLRFTLSKTAPSPIVVRYATGRVEVWNNDPPALRFQRAACSVRVSPISAAAQCLSCAMRSCRIAVEAEPAVRSGKVVRFPQPVAAAS
jgi:hypothetical protein